MRMVLDFTVDVFTGEAAELWVDAFECSSKATWKCMGQNSPFEREEKSFQGITSIFSKQPANLSIGFIVYKQK